MKAEEGKAGSAEKRDSHLSWWEADALLSPNIRTAAVLKKSRLITFIINKT